MYGETTNEEKEKREARRESNPRPRGHKACPQPLCPTLCIKCQNQGRRTLVGLSSLKLLLGFENRLNDRQWLSTLLHFRCCNECTIGKHVQAIAFVIFHPFLTITQKIIGGLIRFFCKKTLNFKKENTPILTTDIVHLFHTKLSL